MTQYTLKKLHDKIIFPESTFQLKNFHKHQTDEY